MKRIFCRFKLLMTTNDLFYLQIFVEITFIHYHIYYYLKLFENKNGKKKTIFRSNDITFYFSQKQSQKDNFIGVRSNFLKTFPITTQQFTRCMCVENIDKMLKDKGNKC